MTTRSVIVALVALLVLSGCASTGVVPVGDGVYMISKQSAAGIFGTPAGVEADIYRQANAFCAARNQVLQTVDVQTQNAVPFAHEGSATLHFRCVPPK
jgi:hypothetical protein